jgi:predicted metal-dependent phosphoesterase TrpH
MTSINLAPAPSWIQQVARNGQTLQQVFQSLDVDSCPRSYNFHTHTIFSDGKLKPETVMQQAIKNRLQGLAITDHHSVGGYQVAKNWLEDWKLENPDESWRAPTLWSGVEINARLLTTEVHILGYDFDPEHPSLEPYLTGQGPIGEDYQGANVIAAIQNAGGIAVLAHPCRYRISAAKLIPEAHRLGIDGVETYYSYGNSKPWRPTPKQTKQVKELGNRYGLLHSCGTDTHGADILLRL